MNNVKMMPSDIIKESTMERHHNAGHKNARVVSWLISLLVLVASPSLVQAAISCSNCHGGGDGSAVKDSTAQGRTVGTVVGNNGTTGTGGQFQGNHATHLSATPQASQCTVCHGANAATYGSDHASNNKYQIQMAAKIDNYSGWHRARYGTRLFWNMTSNTDSTLTTCSNVNCHFEKVTETWGKTTAYGAASTVTCAKCHDALPSTGGHSKHYTIYGSTLATCVRCHTDYTVSAKPYQHATSAGRAIKVTTPYTGAAGSYLPVGNPSQVFGSCATNLCHSAGQDLNAGTSTVISYKSVTWANVGATCATQLCHPTTRAATVSGGHVKHLTGAQATVQCAACHDGVSTDGSTYAYTGGSHLNQQINLSASFGYTLGTVPNNGYGNCTNASCHNNGTTDAGQTTTQWGTSGAPACSACHVQSPTTGRHPKHTTTASAFRSFDCGECHTGAIALVNAGTRHTDGFVNVSSTFGYPTPIAKHASGANAYTGSCSTSYCHSAGQSLVNGNSAVPAYATTAPTWNSTSTAACGSCHPNTLAGTTSGSHAKHLTSTVKTIGCNDCHDNVTSNGSTYNNTTLHINRLIDVSAGQTYDKGGAPGNGYGTCATGTCHNNGTTSAGRTGQWGVPATACTACHGGLITSGAVIATGKHTQHVVLDGAKFSGASYSCDTCHVNAGGPTHINNNIDVSGTIPGRTFGYTATVPLHTVNTAYVGTCSTSYCHSDGKSQYATAPAWGGSASTGCDFCHPMTSLSGAHKVHVGQVNLTSTSRTYANYTANASAGPEVLANGVVYGFGCSVCHPTAVSNHLNGTVDVLATFTADASAGSMRAKNVGATYNSGTGTCANTYCHSSGIGAVANTTIAWNSTFVNAVDRCAKCHGNLPTTGAHGSHKIGIHSDNIFTGTSGFLGYSSIGNVAHGQASQATTISCNICHASTVNTAANKGAVGCTSCHSSDANVALLNATNGYKFHVNGTVDVAFPNTKIKSKAQIRDTSFSVYSGIWVRNGGYKVGSGSFDETKLTLTSGGFTPHATIQGQGSCANVVCHNQRSGDPVVTWNQKLTCEACHSQL
jgi:predicted CxxxxCH...CXXCH cytochrome family protein